MIWFNFEVHGRAVKCGWIFEELFELLLSFLFVVTNLFLEGIQSPKGLCFCSFPFFQPLLIKLLVKFSKLLCQVFYTLVPRRFNVIDKGGVNAPSKAAKGILVRRLKRKRCGRVFGYTFIVSYQMNGRLPLIDLNMCPVFIRVITQIS